jgi:hypothetical protein
MTHGRSQADTGQTDRTLRRARIALAALLLGLIAAGIRVAGLPTSGRGPLHQDGKLVALAVEVALLVLLVAVTRYRARFGPEPDYLPYGLNWALRFLLLVGAVGLPLAALLNLIRPFHSRPRQVKAGGGGRKLRPPRPPGHLDLVILEWVLVILLLVAVAALVVMIWRWRRPAPARAFSAEPDQDFAADLRRAVESGRRALGDITDARAAIIACYVAMEQSLAEAGTVRAVAETPDELLIRAESGGLVRGSAAGRLTALFYRARFSARPMPHANLAAARLALTELAGELGGSLRTELAASTAAGQAGPGQAGPGQAGSGQVSS